MDAEVLGDLIHRDYNGTAQVHTRLGAAAALQPRAYHCGELSQTLGIHGLLQIDPWRPD